MSCGVDTKRFPCDNEPILKYKESSTISLQEIPRMAYQINELLKYSEIDKEQAIEQMVSLFERVGMVDMDYDFCKQIIEDYLKDPFLATKNTDLE